MISWLQIDYYEHDDRESLDKLIDFVSPSYEFRTRVAAAEALSRLDYLDEKLIAYLFDGHFSFNPRLRGPMKDVLDHYMSSLDNQKKIKDVIAKGTWDEWQRKRLNLIMK